MQTEPEFILAGVLMKQHIPAEVTGGALSIFENTSSGNSRTPIHIHANEDETLHVLKGEMRAIVAGTEHTVSKGGSIFLKRGIPHQLMNVSGEPSRYLLICTPGGFEGFLLKGGHLREDGEKVRPPSAEDVERLKAAAPKFGITLLSSW